MLFSKGIDNLAAGAYAGFNKDEEGNITFDPEKFVLGLGGYTAVKAALKNKQVQGVLREYAKKAIDTIDMNPQVYQKEMRGIYSDRNLNVDAHSSGAITSTTSKDNIIPQTKDELNKNILNANAGESLAGGFGGGSETIASQRDWNEDGKVDGVDVLYGAVAGALGLKTTLGGLKRVNPKAYNAIMGASETFPAMAKNNPKLLAELHKNGKANSINMFAGTKALKADVGKLDYAMKLIDDGASEADVWKKTGWFKGDDGKWRFEIDDSKVGVLSKAELDELAKKDPYEMIELPLSQVFKHDDLFVGYPQLREINVNWEYSKAKGLEDEKNIYYGASYDPREKLITIGNGLDDKQIKSSLLHEVQHAVQDIENFARGGSTTSKEYNLLHGEAEARLTQTRAADGYERFPYDDLDVPRDELIKKFDDGAVEMAVSHDEPLSVKMSDLVTEANKVFHTIKHPTQSQKDMLNLINGTKSLIGVRRLDAERLVNVLLERGYQGVNRDGKPTGEGLAHFVFRHYGSGAEGEVSAREILNIGKTIESGKEISKEEFEKISNGKYQFLRGYERSINQQDGTKLYVVVGVDNSGIEHTITYYSNRNRFSEYNYPEPTTQKQDKLAESSATSSKAVSNMQSIAKDYKDSQGFYSVLEKTIDEKVGGKIDSSSLKSMLEKNGVKQDEIEWSGLKELMESKEKLSKDEIENTIKANRLVVEVVERDSQLDKETINSLKMYDNERFAAIEGKIPKYSEYKLDGGENYRELLFRKPVKLPEDVKFIKADDGYWYAEKAPYDGTNVITSSKSKAGLEKEFNVREFKSSHWDEGNILAFTRVDDRTIDNKKTLFAEEIQSDWHQEGRKKGYGKKGVPEAPFEKNWHEFTLKRLMQEAVANDYDKIAWTTGKQQAERYSLEKTVDTVVYNKDAGAIQATNGSKEVFFKRVANEKEIEDIMGKELTARLLDNKSAKNDSVHILQGEELKFGGEGMQGFYDEIVPSAAKKLFKKWGVKPKMEELDDVEQMVWSVDITPQMKDDIKKYGQPLYALPIVGAAGATQGEDNE